MLKTITWRLGFSLIVNLIARFIFNIFFQILSIYLLDLRGFSLIVVASSVHTLDRFGYIATVKATSHVECPPKERHIFSATSVTGPRADVAYCIHALAKRLSKTRSWIVAIKTLIVIHRTLREGEPTFREELLNYSQRGHILQISNFKDDSSPLAWDCSLGLGHMPSF
ncbi:unnamed protein product [Prunus brigantina]